MWDLHPESFSCNLFILLCFTLSFIYVASPPPPCLTFLTSVKLEMGNSGLPGHVPGEPNFLLSKKFWSLNSVYTSLCHCNQCRSPLLAHSLNSQIIQLSRGVFLFTQQDGPPGHMSPTIESSTVIICFFLSFKLLSSLWGATVLSCEEQVVLSILPSCLAWDISLYKVLGRTDEKNWEPHSHFPHLPCFCPFWAKLCCKQPCFLSLYYNSVLT